MPCGSSKIVYPSRASINKNEESGFCTFEDLDHSILQHPLYTGVRNVKQILKCLQDSTKEVKDIILNECNVIYECKVCANLFRSLANLLYHKRCYCKKHLCEEMVLFDNFEEEQAEVVQPELSNEKELTPKLLKCTVDLVKADLGNEESVFVVEAESGVKQKETINKGNEIELKSKEIKKTASMISRRTRDKNLQKAVKKMKLDIMPSNETPSKVRKTDEIEIMDIVSEVVEEKDAPEEIKLDVKGESSNNNADDQEEKIIVEGNKDVKKENNASQTLDNEVLISNNLKPNISKEKDKTEENQNEIKVVNAPKIILKQMKKIIIAKPKIIHIKNPTVLNSLQKNLKTESVGLTEITNAAGKKVHCFPKLYLKTIDGNPHAVFQKAGEKKLSVSTLKNVTEQKSEKFKLVLKNDAFCPDKPDPEKIEETENKIIMKPTGLHNLTRRKSLLARNDCNVHDLKCITCNTIFTSLKTLYFHMLSVHSNKKLYYPCPLCKAYFVKIYGVTRHLTSIHKKTKNQVDKLRDSIKKKSFWKKVDDINVSNDCSISTDKIEAKEPKPEIKAEQIDSAIPALNTVIKLSKNFNLHQCSKCGRVFGRKSSQVSHEKFCIMNAIKVETVDMTALSPPTSPPLISFLSSNQRRQSNESETSKQIQSLRLQVDSDLKLNIRPKRKAEKVMHKDFIDSQTLKWRSVNKVVNNTKPAPATKSSPVKNLEKKISNIMNVDNLTCLKCGKIFSSYSNLKRHAAIHVGWTRFKCIICDYQAYNKSQCWFHIQKVHEISEESIENFVQNLGSNRLLQKPMLYHQNKTSKNNSSGNLKQNLKKQGSLQKSKVMKRKNIVKQSKKKFQHIKKPALDNKKDPDSKKERVIENKRDVDSKKEKVQNVESIKEINEQKREKSQISDSKEKTNPKKENSHQSYSSIPKSIVVPHFKDLKNYKSLTTNNPTTIILSKKLPSSSVQSVVTIPTESQSSTFANKTFPLRSSPRMVEIKSIKFPEKKGLICSDTRSTAYAKNSVQIKITPPRINSDENIKKPMTQSAEKTSPKKDKLISEWFSKKDLNSNTSRRESAPLIIGLVPASSSGLNVHTKNPSITYEKNDD